MVLTVPVETVKVLFDVTVFTDTVFDNVFPIRDENDNVIALIVEPEKLLFTVMEPTERVFPIPPTYDRLVTDKVEIPVNALVLTIVVYNTDVEMDAVDTDTVDIVLARMVPVPVK